MSIAYTLTGDAISAVVNGKVHTVSEKHPNWDAIIAALNNQDEAAFHDAIDIPATITTRSEGRVQVVDGELYYDGEPFNHTCTSTLLTMMNMGLDIQPMLNYIEREAQNPSFRARKELWRFLEANGMTILPDGRFVAHKSVRDDYYDVHSGTIRNMVGDTPEIPRHMVDDDPSHACSYGLHVCSPTYGMFGSRLLLVAVDPADVVSVPYEYKNNKMRVCRYEVIEELEEFRTFSEPVYDGPSVDEYEVEDSSIGTGDTLYVVTMSVDDFDGGTYHRVKYVWADDADNARDDAEMLVDRDDEMWSGLDDLDDDTIRVVSVGRADN